MFRSFAASSSSLSFVPLRLLLFLKTSLMLGFYYGAKLGFLIGFSEIRHFGSFSMLACHVLWEVCEYM